MRIARDYHVPCDARPNDADDAELVERTLDGDSEAFETLVCRYGSKYYRLAESIVDNESDAQDVLQKALLKIHRKLETLRNPSSFNSWAYRIVKNAALMEVRSRKRSDEIGFGDLGPGRDDERHFESEAPAWRHRGDEALESLELRGKLEEAIGELEPTYQTPFVLYEFEGCELSEIGEALDLSVAGVKSRLHRARLRLRATLERYLRDDLGEIER
jgi:RNA polymerase sigma-70 factor (ECF subfamily)